MFKIEESAPVNSKSEKTKKGILEMSDEEIEARGINLELKKGIEAIREFNRKKYENMDRFRAEKEYALFRNETMKESEKIENKKITDPKEKAIRKIAEMGKNWEENLLKIFVKIDEREKMLIEKFEALRDLEKEKQNEIEYQKILKELKESGEIEDEVEDDDEYEQENIRGNLRDLDKDDEDDEYWYRKVILDLLADKKSQKGIDFFLERLKNDEEFVQVYQYEINRLFKSDEQYTLKKITEIFKNDDLDEKAMFRLVTTTTDVYGELFMRDRINALILEAGIAGNEAVIKKLEHINSFIAPNSDKKAIRNLQEFYQTKIKFEDYKINERMNEKEVALLKELVEKDDTILEMGCGTGRLTVEMAKSGYDVSGYDYTQRHAQITKEKLAENRIDAKVFQGDWHNNALKDESFDAVYSLGRNILHDYSVISQAELFREAARILKDGGKFIFDIPNREKGGYKELVEGYANEMKKRGIDNFRYGAIYDSPDGINFATRYAYSPEDISQLAQISGFEISEARKENLETGKDDENLYYVLTKKNKN